MKFNKKLLKMTGCEDYRQFFMAFGEWYEVTDFTGNEKGLFDIEYALEMFLSQLID